MLNESLVTKSNNLLHVMIFKHTRGLTIFDPKGSSLQLTPLSCYPPGEGGLSPHMGENKWKDEAAGVKRAHIGTELNYQTT